MTLSQFLFTISPFISVTVHGNSMIPTIQNGEKIFVMKYVLIKPRTGDVIVCKHPLTRKVLIKRIMKINKHKFWIEGDNLRESTDSRKFGWITSDEVIGKALVK